MELRKFIYLLGIILSLSACETSEVSEDDNNFIKNEQTQTTTESNNDSSSGNTQSTNISSITPQGFSIEAKDYSINLSYTVNAASIKSFIQDTTKKSILIGLGWVWRDYYANGEDDPMPLNLILEDLGTRYYTITGRDLTYNIRDETVFFPSTVDVITEPINCSD